MALTTFQSQYSVINIGSPWRAILPIPDGNADAEATQAFQQVLLFLADQPEAQFTAAESDFFGWGSGYPKKWKKFADAEEERRKKRRRDLARLDELLDGLQKQIPISEQEARPLVVARRAIDVAAEKLAEPKRPGVVIDLKALSADVERANGHIAQAEKALVSYKARKKAERDLAEVREIEARLEEDDEDVLLLMAEI